MATVFRVNKDRNYTVISNRHLRDRNLSWKAKSVLTLMLSLPDNWDYTLRGLLCFCADGIDATRSAIQELEEHGYLERKQRQRNSKGQYETTEYIVYEEPQPVPAQADQTPAAGVTAEAMEEEVPAPAETAPENLAGTAFPSMLENPTWINLSEQAATLENPTWIDSSEQAATLENPTLENPTLGNPTQINTELQSTELQKIDRWIDGYIAAVKKQVEFGAYEQMRDLHLTATAAKDVERAQSLVHIMAETLCLCDRNQQIKVGRSVYPAALVRDRLREITPEVFEYVVNSVEEELPRQKVLNLYAYLLTALLHGSTTYGHYIANQEQLADAVCGERVGNTG